MSPGSANATVAAGTADASRTRATSSRSDARLKLGATWTATTGRVNAGGAIWDRWAEPPKTETAAGSTTVPPLVTTQWAAVTTTSSVSSEPPQNPPGTPT